MEAATTSEQDGSAGVGQTGTVDQVKEKAGEAAEQAREQVQGLAGQSRDRARSEVDRRSTEAGDRVSETAGDLRSVSEELRNQGKDGPAKIADQAAERFDRAGSYLRENDADQFLRDVEDFGRKRPWAVLAGAAVAGLAAARVLKASSDERYATSAQKTAGDQHYATSAHRGGPGSVLPSTAQRGETDG
jgi:ElaB/YqjD/DUF883 family membrane-anchored ribosome-binding protein